MVSIEFEGSKIIKSKEHYKFIDQITPVGESSTAYKSVDGVTYIQDKRVRKDGSIKQIGFEFLCTYDERQTLSDMVFGRTKVCKRNPAKLSITDEQDRNTECLLVSAESSFYEERNIVEDVEISKKTHEELGISDDSTVYEVYVAFVMV